MSAKEYSSTLDQEEDEYLDCFILICLLDVLERLIKENISTGVGVLQHDLTTKQVFPTHASPVKMIIRKIFQPYKFTPFSI